MKETHFQIKGISQDLAYLLFNPQYAFEMKNIRINTTDENSLLSLTNEKGNTKTSAVIIKDGKEIPVIVLGWGQFSDYTVLFSKNLGFITVYSDDTSLSLPYDFEGRRIKTVEEKATTTVNIPITTIKVRNSEGTGLEEITLNEVSNIFPLEVTPTGMTSADKMFASFDSYPGVVTIEKYYAAFKFTDIVIERLEGLAKACTMFVGMKKNWSIKWPSADGSSYRVIAGSNEDESLAGNLLNKYLVYNFVTLTWTFTDNLEAITVTSVPDPTATTNLDFISVMKSDGSVKLLYLGDLNFKEDHIIHTVCVYENEDVQKVYWIDGVNIPRVANVAPNTWDDNTKNISFLKLDFIPTLTYGENVTITRTSGGRFPAGVVQYAFTYSDKNLQETNIFYVSPLYYSTQSNRGATADSVCNIAFDITVNNADTRFDYIQAYAIIRTSLDAIPAIYRIADIPCDKTTVRFTDNGTQWEAYSPDELLLKQLNTFTPLIMASKDSTLFLGNYTLKSPFADEKALSSFMSALSADTLMVYRNLDFQDSDYSFNLTNGSNAIKTFRNGEYYRLGVQFQDEKGTPTNILYLKDITSQMAIDPESPEFKRKVVQTIINSTTVGLLPANNVLKRIRLMMVDRSRLPRRTLCQGVLCPTVYKVNDRVNNLPFAMSSWNMRGFQTDAFINHNATPEVAGAQWMTDMPILPNLTLYGGEVQNQDNSATGVEIENNKASDSSVTLDTTLHSGDDIYYLARVWVLNQYWDGKTTEVDGRTVGNLIIDFKIGRTTNSSITSVNNADPLTGRGYKQSKFGIFSIYNYCIEHGYSPYSNAGLKNYLLDLTIELLQRYEGIADATAIAGSLFSDWVSGREPLDLYGTQYLTMRLLGAANGGSPNYDAKTTYYISNTFDNAVNLAVNRPYFFCDHNILTFHSPDVEANQSLIDNNASIKYKIVGYTLIEKTNFANYLIMDRGAASNAASEGQLLIKRNSQTGMYAVPLWKDGDTYGTYVWHRSVSLGNQNEPDDKGRVYGSYKRKVFSNLHFCVTSYAFSNASKVFDISPSSTAGANHYFPDMGTPRVFNSNEVTALTLDKQPYSTCIHNKLIYYGNVNMSHVGSGYYITKMTADGGHLENSATMSTDPCIIRYKSTPHVVMPMTFMERDGVYYAPALPIPSPRNTALDKWTRLDYDDKVHGYLWGSTVHGFQRTVVNISLLTQDWDGLLYIAELYLDLSVNQIYGDTSEDNLAKYNWVPISDWVDLAEGSTIEGYGDTFIGRWDCLKTYSFSEDDAQSYVDITSFIVESDINLESRCDNYKGVQDATMVNPTNFNLFNPVYDQDNNFFRYNYLKQSELLNNFQNQVCWSEVKVLGEELDTWTLINVGNNTDFQGEYGQLRAAANLGNNLYFLQDDALYKLNYNTRVAISPTDGVPIQISNNYSVDPPLLIKQYCGTMSQEKLIATPSLVYFHDPNRNRIFALSPEDKVEDLSSDKGVNSLVNKLGEVRRTFYDSISKDVYFNFDNTTLAFNEDLMEFTSLYDYHGITSLFSLEGETYTTYGANIFKQRAGDYNYFFGKFKPFYIEVLANAEPLIDKTFSNIEYTLVGDNDAEMSEAKDEHGVLKPLDSFDTLDVKTSYQSATVNLNAQRIKPSNLKRKFRIWRTDIPRATGSMDRMRDLWMKAKLTKSTDNKNKYRMNNINVTYTII